MTSPIQSLDLVHPLFTGLTMMDNDNQLGNGNTIRRGKRDIRAGEMMHFNELDNDKQPTGRTFPVYVTKVSHKTLGEITDAEAQRNGARNAAHCVTNMNSYYDNLKTTETMTVIEYTPYQKLLLNHSTLRSGQARWLGGSVQARWTEAGESFVNQDGKKMTCKGGEVAILKPDSVSLDNPLGDIDLALKQAVADKRYILDILPQSKIDTRVFSIDRVPQQVRLLNIASPTYYITHDGSRHYANPGDTLEYNKAATRNIRPITEDMRQTRYISAEEASATLSQLGR